MDSSRFKKYLLYALGEIVLVVIGILIALQVNNANEFRKERSLELQMLRELKVGLEDDVSDIKYNIGAHQRILRSQKILIDWIDSDRPYHDTIGSHFSWSNGSTVFVSNEGPYTTLKGLGIRMVQSDSLRDKIMEVYDLRFDYYKDHIGMYNDLVFHAWKYANAPYFESTQFKFINPEAKMKPVNVDDIKGITDFGYHLKTMATFNEFYIERIMKRAQRSAEELIGMLDRELERRG